MCEAEEDDDDVNDDLLEFNEFHLKDESCVWRYDTGKTSCTVSIIGRANQASCLTNTHLEKRSNTY